MLEFANECLQKLSDDRNLTFSESGKDFCFVSVVPDLNCLVFFAAGFCKRQSAFGILNHQAPFGQFSNCIGTIGWCGKDALNEISDELRLVCVEREQHSALQVVHTFCPPMFLKPARTQPRRILKQ